MSLSNFSHIFLKGVVLYNKLYVCMYSDIAHGYNGGFGGVEKKRRLYDCDIILSRLDIFKKDLFVMKCDVLINFKRYSVLFRVCYSEGSMFKSLGSQYTFHVKSSNERVNELNTMYKLILDRLREAMIKYNFTAGDIVSIQLLILELYYTDLINKPEPFKLDFIPAEFLNMSSKKSDLVFNKLVPRSMDISNYATGFKLVTKDIIDKVIKFNEKSDFLNGNVIKYVDRKGKRLLTLEETIDNDNNRVIKGALFDLKGNRITEYVDTFVSNDLFKRTMGTVTNHINDRGEIVRTSTKIPLKSIQVLSNQKRTYSTFKRTYPGPEYRIGTIDLETFKDIDGISKVYAAGIYTNQYEDKIFYINKDTLDSTDVLYRLYDEVISSKYHKYTFYIHNAGKFDFAFMLLPVVNHPDKIYKEKIFLRDSTILSIKIDKGGKGKIVVEFVDSYNILTNSLSDLCKSYGTIVQKGVFPHRFVTRHRLFYFGVKPDISYYEGCDRDVYNEIPMTNFDLEKICKKYLLNDLVSLYQVITKFKIEIYDRYKVHVSDCKTITSISMEIYKTNFYDSITTPIPWISNKSVHDDIRGSYYGGITEVYIPKNDRELLYYYDVNSLYPYAALNDMPGLECEFVPNINVKFLENTELYGFYYSKVRSNDGYYGLLPLRNEDNSILMPNGEWYGWYFSEELRLASKHGYDIEVLKGYNFNKVENTFKKFVEHFYVIKSTTKDMVVKDLSKRILNHLFGKFGQDFTKPVVELVDRDRLNEIIQTHVVIDQLIIGDKYWVKYDPNVSKKICDASEVDFYKVHSYELKTRGFKDSKFKDVSIAIASAVTSYARVYMNKTKLMLEYLGIKIYYSDTDSLVTDKPMPKELVGSMIGQFKLEHIVKRAYFISNKTYCLILNDERESEVIKAKGVTKTNENIAKLEEDRLKGSKDDGNRYILAVSDFEKLYYGNENVRIKRKTSSRNISAGYTNIEDTPITIGWDAYLKREKLYDKHGRWVNTKPNIIKRTV